MLSVGTPNEKLHRKSLLRQSRSLTRVSGAAAGAGGGGGDGHNTKQGGNTNNNTSPVLHEGRLTFAAGGRGGALTSSGSCQTLSCSVGSSGASSGGGNVIVRSEKSSSSLLVELSPYNLFSILPSSLPTTTQQQQQQQHHTAALNLRWNKNGEQERQHSKPAPLVIAGPSGSGKSTLLKLLMKEFNDCFGFSISRKCSQMFACSGKGLFY